MDQLVMVQIRVAAMMKEKAFDGGAMESLRSACTEALRWIQGTVHLDTLFQSIDRRLMAVQLFSDSGWLPVKIEEAHGRVSRVGVELRRHGKSLHPNISEGNYTELQN